MPKKRILVVDDEVGFTKMLSLALSEYEVAVENDPTRALEGALQFRPDLILLDMVMPTLDGGDVALQIRGTPELAHVPIVFLTAIVSESALGPGSLIGGFPFLAKPIAVKRLREALAEQLAAAKSLIPN